MDAPLIVKIVIVAAAALLLGQLYLFLRRRDLGKRDHMLDAVAGALDGALVGRSSWGYETVAGTLDGRPARASLFPDSLVTRTLPTLWLDVSWEAPHAGWLCMLVAANGMEYFAEEVDHGARIPAPPGWPVGTVVRGKDERSAALARRLGALDPRDYRDLKMVLLTETSTRVVMRCARADATSYRVLRAADFAEDAVPPELVAQTVAALRDIERAIDEEEEVA